MRVWVAFSLWKSDIRNLHIRNMNSNAIVVYEVSILSSARIPNNVLLSILDLGWCYCGITSEREIERVCVCNVFVSLCLSVYISNHNSQLMSTALHLVFAQSTKANIFKSSAELPPRVSLSIVSARALVCRQIALLEHWKRNAMQLIFM